MTLTSDPLTLKVCGRRRRRGRGGGGLEEEEEEEEEEEAEEEEPAGCSLQCLSATRCVERYMYGLGVTAFAATRIDIKQKYYKGCNFYLIGK